MEKHYRLRHTKSLYDMLSPISLMRTPSWLLQLAHTPLILGMPFLEYIDTLIKWKKWRVSFPFALRPIDDSQVTPLLMIHRSRLIDLFVPQSRRSRSHFTQHNLPWHPQNLSLVCKWLTLSLRPFPSIRSVSRKVNKSIWLISTQHLWTLAL